MSENAKVRAQELYGQPFGPSATAVPTDVRIANALEYIASQVGEIRRGLEALNKRESEGMGPSLKGWPDTAGRVISNGQLLPEV